MSLKKIDNVLNIIENFDDSKINVSFLFMTGRTGSVFIQSLLDSHEQILQLPFIFPFYISYEYFESNSHILNDKIYVAQLITQEIKILMQNDFFCGLGEKRDEVIEIDLNLFNYYLKEIFANIGFLSSKNLFLSINFAYALSENIDISKIKLIFCHHHFFMKNPFNFTYLTENKLFFEYAYKNKFEIGSFSLVDKMKTDFKNVKFIISIRNPFETFYSYFSSIYNKKIIDLYSYFSKLTTISNGYNNLNNIEKKYQNNYLIIKLEDLHNIPETIIIQLAQFLNINFNKTLYKSTIYGKKMWISSLEKDKQALESKFDPKISVYRWINKLDNDLKIPVYNLLKTITIKYDYLESEFNKISSFNNNNNMIVSNYKILISLIYSNFNFIELYDKKFMSKNYLLFEESFPFFIKCIKSLLNEEDDYLFDNSFYYLNKKIRLQYKLLSITEEDTLDSYLILFVANNNIPNKNDIDKINFKVDRIFVSSNYLKNYLIEIGILKSKIDLINYPIDIELYDKKNLQFLENIEGFKFLYIINYDDNEYTKLIEKCFIEEFNQNENVYLIFKHIETISDVDYLSKIKNYLNLNNKNIILIEDKFYDVENIVNYNSCFSKLYNSCDFLISSFDNDYSGINIVKSLFFDLPVITSNKNVYFEFCNEKNSIKIEIAEDELIPKETELKKAMRYAYDNRNTFKKNTLEASKNIREKHNIDFFMEQFNNSLQNIFELDPINSNLKKILF